MRFFALIPALAAFVTAVSAAATDGCPTEMGCDTHVAPKRDFLPHSSRDGHALTNAELLRRGLPLKSPVLRRGSPVRRGGAPNPSAVPPPVQVTHAGVIEVRDPNNNLLGYVSKNLGNGGAQCVYDPSISNAALVTFQTDSGAATSDHIDISFTNSNPAWPYLGLIQGRDDTDSNLKDNSYQYLYLGGVDNPGTQPGAGPQNINNSYFIGAPRTAETAVWSFDATSHILSPQWINTDGSAPDEDFFTQSSGLYVGGDKDAFFSRFPAPVTSITFHFVPQ